MNTKDRAQLNKLHGEVIVLQNAMEELRQKAQDIGAQFQELADAEQDKFDSLPEGLAAGEKGDKMSEQADELSSIAGDLENGDIDDAIDRLEAFPL